MIRSDAHGEIPRYHGLSEAPYNFILTSTLCGAYPLGHHFIRV